MDEDRRYSAAEETRILRELEQHLREAREAGDEARVFYTQEAISAAEYG